MREAGAVVIGTVLAGLALWFIVGDGKKTIAQAGNAINPTNPDNIFSNFATEVTRVITGSKVDTLGTSLASGYSDRVGAEITAPVPIVNGRAVRLPTVEEQFITMTPFWYGGP